jgi:hypothetical protein
MDVPIEPRHRASRATLPASLTADARSPRHSKPVRLDAQPWRESALPVEAAPEPEHRSPLASRDGRERLAPLRPPPRAERERRAEILAPAPDVHIHIGRVELTALAPPVPSRRETASAARKPMSLDEYLRKRNRPRT